MCHSHLLTFSLHIAALTCQAQQVITYEQLLQKKTERTVSWHNPDSTSEELIFIEMPIPVDDEMRSLTRKFMIDNYGRTSIWVEPRMIMIHATDLGDLRTTLERSSFLARTMPQRWETQIKAGALPSGIHFIVDKDGTIYCLTPPTADDNDSLISYGPGHRWLVRRHFDANTMAIGIENVTLRNRSYEDLSDAQIEADAKLIRWLLRLENGSITHVVTHNQFNDTTEFDAMVKQFSIKLPRPMYRAWTRKDAGNVVHSRIVEKVRGRRWKVEMKFSGK